MDIRTEIERLRIAMEKITGTGAIDKARRRAIQVQINQLLAELIEE